MNRIIIILAAALALIVIVASPTQATPNLAASTTKETDARAEVILGVVSPSSTASCYVCSDPCGSIYCCSGDHPQCCWVSGYGCGCCRY